MRLNGKTFMLYTTDTAETIVDRIASVMNTIPSWLIFSPAKPLSKKEFESSDLSVVDYLAKVRRATTLTVPAPPYPVGITEEQVHDVFVASNDVLEQANTDRSGMFPHYIVSLKGKVYKDPETIWRGRDAIIGNIAKQIRKNKTVSDDLTKNMSRLESITPLEFTEIVTDRIQFTVDFGPYAGSLIDLFNSSTPDVYVPYIACSLGPHDMYKVFRDFQMNPEWLSFRLTNVMLLKVNTETASRESGGIYKYRHYTSAALTVTDANHLLCTMDAVVGGDKYVSRNEFIRRVMTVVGRDAPAESSITNNLIITHFAIPRQCLDAAVFSDIAMMNDTLNRFVAIDEFANASRASTSSVYVKRLGASGDASSLTLKQTVYVGEYGMRSIGEWYVLCRMRTTDAVGATVMQNLIAKVLSVYNTEHAGVSDEYKSALGDLYTPVTCRGEAATKRVRNIKGYKGLRAIEPEIFYPRFTRRCTNPPVSVESSAETQRQTMLFPTKGELGADGSPIKPRLYTCPTEEHGYIGLRDNDLPNKDRFPYVPCCFAKDQTQKRGSGYRVYHYGERPLKKRVVFEEPEIGEVIPRLRRPGGVSPETPRVLGEELDVPGELSPGQLAPLPPMLSKFFQVISLDPTHKYERCGVRGNRVSAIECILYSRGAIKYKKMRISTVNNRVGRETSKLAANIDAYAMAAKQELYDMRLKEIKTALMTHHLVPSSFIRVLELLLDCNIFVFDESGLVVPHHSRMYIKLVPTRETFFLYENSNGIVDVIGVRDAFGPKESFTSVFGSTSAVTKRIYDVFVRMTSVYVGNTPFPKHRLSRMLVAEQVLDSHGKCRAIVVLQGSNRISLVPDDPLPPFAATEATSLPRITVKEAEDASKVFKDCTIIDRRIVKNVSREIRIRLGTTYMTILVNDDAASTIALSHDRPRYDHLESVGVLVEHRKSKRNALLVLENVINHIVGEMRKGVMLDTALKAYAVANGGLTDDNKRLLYACKQWIRTHDTGGTARLAHAVDLDADVPMSYVLDGRDAANNLVQTYQYDYWRYYTELKDSTVNYFFEAGGEMYLAVPIQNIEEGNAVIAAWLKHGRVRHEDVTDTDIGANVYAKVYVVSSDGLTKIRGGDDARGCKIVIQDETRIAALIRI